MTFSVRTPCFPGYGGQGQISHRTKGDLVGSEDRCKSMSSVNSGGDVENISNKKLLVTKGIATRSKDATSSSSPYYKATMNLPDWEHFRRCRFVGTALCGPVLGLVKEMSCRGTQAYGCQRYVIFGRTSRTVCFALICGRQMQNAEMNTGQNEHHHFWECISLKNTTL